MHCVSKQNTFIVIVGIAACYTKQMRTLRLKKKQILEKVQDVVCFCVGEENYCKNEQKKRKIQTDDVHTNEYSPNTTPYMLCLIISIKKMQFPFDSRTSWICFYLLREQLSNGFINESSNDRLLKVVTYVELNVEMYNNSSTVYIAYDHTKYSYDMIKLSGIIKISNPITRHFPRRKSN
ncbi:hypothetical protein BDC45DRAFT_540201 [Circinella umbellata]|nr:hypothetical protein BDC45DRAFT_540201 [Circinella umbellata]